MRIGSFFAISVPGSKKYWSSNSSSVCCVMCTFLNGENKSRKLNKRSMVLNLLNAINLELGWKTISVVDCNKYPGTPVVSKRLAMLTSFDQMSYCHLQAPITPLIIEPECTPIRISIFRLFRWARTSRISRIMRSPRSTQLLAWYGFGSGTPDTQ